MEKRRVILSGSLSQYLMVKPYYKDLLAALSKKNNSKSYMDIVHKYINENSMETRRRFLALTFKFVQVFYAEELQRHSSPMKCRFERSR